MICENCGNEHSAEFGSGRFCSLKCSRAFSTKNKRIEINERVSNTLKGRVSTQLSDEAKSNKIAKFVKTRKTNLFNNLITCDFITLSYEKKKQRIYHEQSGQCNKCNNSTWLDSSIPLELEHIDGNRKNNDRSNLELLCPNCHALTSTWRGRNKTTKFGDKKVSDAELLTALIKHEWIIYRALVEVNLTPKGANYGRCKKLKDSHFS